MLPKTVPQDLDPLDWSVRLGEGELGGLLRTFTNTQIQLSLFILVYKLGYKIRTWRFSAIDDWLILIWQTPNVN